MALAPKRRCFSFSLRTMFVVVTVAATGTLGMKWLLRDIRSEVEAKAIGHLLKATPYKKEQLRAEAFPDGDAWTVYVYYVPATPDFMWTLKVSARGEVSDP